MHIYVNTQTYKLIYNKLKLLVMSIRIYYTSLQQGVYVIFFLLVANGINEQENFISNFITSDNA